MNGLRIIQCGLGGGVETYISGSERQTSSICVQCVSVYASRETSLILYGGQMTDEEVALELGWKKINNDSGMGVHYVRDNEIRPTYMGPPQYTTSLEVIVVEVERRGVNFKKEVMLNMTEYGDDLWDAETVCKHVLSRLEGQDV